MAPIVTSVAAWPVAITYARGLATLAEHEAYLAEWSGWFARGERFFVLRVFADEASLEQAEGVGRVTRTWLNETAGEAIRAQVIAMVNVVPASVYPRMARLSVDKVFGVPGLITAELWAGLHWLTAEAGFTGDGREVAALISSMEDGRG